MKPIYINQDNSSERFLYLQLYDEIKKRVLSGEMKAGEKLPSLRTLAKELGISITTTSLAYNQLLVEGYIVSRPKSGYFIADIFPSALRKINAEAFNADSKSRKAGTKKSPVDFATSSNCDARTAEHSASPANSDMCAVGNIGGFSFPASAYISDPGCFDFVKWKKCSARVFNEYSELLLFESDPQGEAALRYEISKYLYSSRGVNASPESIVIGAGTQQITSHLSRILAKMDIRLVCLEAPGYLPVQSMFRDAGFSISHIPVKRDGIDIAKLPANIRSAVYVNPSNQFPTGAVMPAGRRYELLDWAAANGSVIIEDDYDSELRYFGKPVPALQGLDKPDCVVYLGSFSSTLFPAIKISYMVLPEKMAEIFRSIKHEYTQTCSKAEQLTLALFMEDGYYYTGIRKLRSLYAQKLQTALAAFSAHGGGVATPINTHSGINLTVKVRSQKKAGQLCEDAKLLGLQMVPLSEISDQETSALIFYYSRLPLERIEPLIRQLLELWRKL